MGHEDCENGCEEIERKLCNHLVRPGVKFCECTCHDHLEHWEGEALEELDHNEPEKYEEKVEAEYGAFIYQEEAKVKPTGNLVTVYALHGPEQEKLEQIRVEMQKNFGPPNLRAVMVEGEVFALEGSHRLAAARLLGPDFKPKLTLLSADDAWPGDIDTEVIVGGVNVILMRVGDVIPALNTNFPYVFPEPLWE